MDNERSEVAFFDIETTVPTRPGQGFAILEFGAILVCPRKLIEQETYSTLVRPNDSGLISTLSVRCNGITPEAVTCAPTFSEIADKVYDILHGRIWAGHNIVKFDCHRIKEAFAGINKPAPEPKGIIDTLALLTQRFGRRAGNMKMASLATYFGLGQQTHRSLDDVRMNLEVLKYCATVLLLESSLPEIFTEKSWVSPNAITRSRSSGRVIPQETGFGADTPPSSVRMESHVEFSEENSITRSRTSGRAIPEETGFSADTPSSSVRMESAAENAVKRAHTSGRVIPQETGFSADTSSSSVNIESHVESSAENAITRSRTSGRAIPVKTGFDAYTPSVSVRMEHNMESTPENAITRSRTSSRAIPEETGFGADTPSSNVKMESHVESTAEIDPFNMVKLEESLLSDELEDEATSSYLPESPTSTVTEFIGCADFLEPNEISIPSISVSLGPFYHGSQKIQVLHDCGELQVCCIRMKVRFGIGKKYLDKAGRPRLSFVVDASSDLCQILDAVDNLAQKLSVGSGSSSEWRPVVTRKPGFMNYPTIRLNLPTVVDGNVSRWATEIYQKESSTTQKLVFGRFDVEELEFLITPGTLVDAYFSMDSYDFQQKAGIRLVAEKLIVHSTL